MPPVVHEFGHMLELLLETGDEVVRPVLKEDDKAEGEEHKQHEPKETADDTHAAHVNLPARDGQRSSAGGIRQPGAPVLR